ncbi:MAG TPA: hypothetical protein VFY87_02245 [Geminicoccaceae bacterium]|nr:hypothetical protein [Geminicoccaceae bacterium]
MTHHSRLANRSVMALALARGAFAAPSLGWTQPANPSGMVTPERLLDAAKEEGNWLHHHRDYAAHRFSPLAEINRGNVKDLKVAWTMALGGVERGGIWSHGGLEGTPLAEDGFLYVTDGWGSVYKVDAHGGRGSVV